MMTPNFRKALTTCALLAFLAPSLKAAVIIDANFNTGTFASAGLVDYSTQGDPAIQATIGVGAPTPSPGLTFGNNGMAATASMSITTTATFSMFGRFTENTNGITPTQTAGSAMSFGWTKASDPFRTFQGTNTSAPIVALTDTIMVGLARTTTNGFSLGFGNGGTGAVSNNLFGNSVAYGALKVSHWYRLEGTIEYNSSTGTFTFLNFSLDDFGLNGTTEEVANILFGTNGSLTLAGFGTTARAIWANNGDRGVVNLDNLYLATVPEPTLTLLLAVGGFATLMRRRRSSIPTKICESVA